MAADLFIRAFPEKWNQYANEGFLYAKNKNIIGAKNSMADLIHISYENIGIDLLNPNRSITKEQHERAWQEKERLEAEYREKINEWLNTFSDDLKFEIEEYQSQFHRYRNGEVDWGHLVNDVVWYLIARMDSVWIGENSTLKAALFQDTEAFIPGVCGKMWDIFEDVDEMHVLDEEFKQRILSVWDNVTPHDLYEVAEKEVVESWLDEHMGSILILSNE